MLFFGKKKWTDVSDPATLRNRPDGREKYYDIYPFIRSVTSVLPEHLLTRTTIFSHGGLFCLLGLVSHQQRKELKRII